MGVYRGMLDWMQRGTDGCLERHARLEVEGNGWVSREAC